MRKDGRFQLADGGTLFLDEIGEISQAIQVKLLRFLQEHEYERVGGTQTIRVDVRVIAATNRNLVDEVAKGRFREDLYYRLNVVALEMPPLRERKSDITALAKFVLDRYAILETHKATGGSTSKAAEILGISVRTIQYRLHQYNEAPRSDIEVVRKMVAGAESATE